MFCQDTKRSCKVSTQRFVRTQKGPVRSGHAMFCQDTKRSCKVRAENVLEEVGVGRTRYATRYKLTSWVLAPLQDWHKLN